MTEQNQKPGIDIHIPGSTKGIAILALVLMIAIAGGITIYNSVVVPVQQKAVQKSAEIKTSIEPQAVAIAQDEAAAVQAAQMTLEEASIKITNIRVSKSGVEGLRFFKSLHYRWTEFKGKKLVLAGSYKGKEFALFMVKKDKWQLVRE